MGGGGEGKGKGGASGPRNIEIYPEKGLSLTAMRGGARAQKE